MAWFESAKSQLNNSKERSFYADLESDVANLPNVNSDYPGGIAPGSDCLVIESSNVYILGSDGETWGVL